MTELAPDWATGVNAAIHNPPAQVGGGWQPPMPWQQLLATVQFFLDSFIGQIAVALGGIEIFGWRPLQFLADWGQDRIDEASHAFTAATAAQSTANVAQTNATSALTQIGQLLFNLANNVGAVITSIPQQLVNGLQGGLAFLNTAITAAGNFIQSVINAIWSALRSIPVLGGFVPGAPDLQKAVADNKANSQNFVITAVVSTARNDAFKFRHPIGDVSYPEFENNRSDVFGTTDSALTSTNAHTHTLNATNSAWAVPAGRLLIAGGSRGVYITTTSTTVYDTVMVLAWRDAGTASNIFLDVFRERSDGSLYQLTSQNITSSVPTTSNYLQFTLPEQIVAEAGERYMVRIRNGSAVQMWIASMIETNGAQQQGFYYSSGALATATSYTAAQAVTARANTTSVNWAGLACVNMPPTDRSHEDDYNRDSLGGSYIRKSSTASQADIYANQLGYTGVDDGWQAVLYIHRTTRNTNRVESNVYVNTNSTVRLGPMLHCSRDFAQVVHLGVNETSAKIYSGPVGSLTERASINVGGTGKWTLYYNEALDQYAALKDDTDIGLKWSSAGSAVSHGTDYLYGGQRISCVSGEPAGTLDDWRLRDWSVVVSAIINAPRMEATAAMVAAAVKAGASIAAPRMEATATLAGADVEAAVAIAAPRMEATAAMNDPDLSDNTAFTYTFPFALG